MTYDIGGTYIKFGVFSQMGKLREKGKFDSASGDDFLERLEQHIWEYQLKYDLSGIGIGVPGLVKDGVVVAAVNLGLTGIPLKKRLEDQLGMPVTVANDATLAAWGEKQAGTVADPSNFLLVTIGTGIGSGIVLEGQLMEGKYGSFGELGHTVIEPGGRPCKCKNKGCLEQYVSISGLLANYQATFGETLTMGQLIHADPLKLDQVMDQSAQKLGLALANAAILLDLRTILVGGGLSEIEGFIPKIQHWVNHFIMPSLAPIRVDKASLGNDAALYGAYFWHKAQNIRGDS